MSSSFGAALSAEENIAVSATLPSSATKNNNTIDTPTQTKLASIEVTGVDGDLKKNIELHMPLTVPECLADRAEVSQFFTAVKKNLRKATRALGYYDTEFTSSGSIVSGCWKLGMKVKPGKPTKILKQTIKIVGPGATEEGFRKILAEPPYKNGDILNHDKYSTFKALLSEEAQALGYFDAEYEQHTIRVDPASYLATIDLVLNTGKRYQYGEIRTDQKLLSNTAFNKYLIVKTGQPFSTEELINQQQLLQSSGYFKLIKINVLYEQTKNQQVPIEIVLTPQKRNAYKFKIGYGSDTGARIAGEMNRRWTGSGGKKVKLKAQYAQTLSGISAQLINPRKNPEDNSLIYNIDWIKDANDDVVSNSIDIGAKRVRKKSNDWIQTSSINILRDRTQVEGEDETLSTLLLFGVGLDKIKTDSLLFPDNGWRLKFGIKAASKVLLSDQDVVQIKAHAKKIKTLGSGRLLTRLNIGSTYVNDFDRLPKSLRFFAGGSNSVRGYSFESLGEVNDEGKVIGGQNLLDLSLEYQHPITDEWSAALFVDAGNAFDDWKDPKLEVGMGFGAHWRSPIGPVRIDIGFPEGRFKEPQLHLSVGSDL
jgi:translocation and assembly module TamA